LVLIGVLPMLGMLTDSRTAAFGFVFLIFPILAYTSLFGSEFSEDLKRMREFSLIIGFRKGKWIDLNAYSDLVIIQLSRSGGMFSRTGRSTQYDASKIEIYLMTPDLRHRLLVNVCKSGEEAIEVSEKLAQTLNKKLTAFKPFISEKSKRSKLQGVR